MTLRKLSHSRSLRIRQYTWALVGIWTSVVAVSWGWNLTEINRHTLVAARIQGRTAIEKDMDYRLWITGHGKVYVPMTERFQPNPSLRVPDRDVTTQSGLKLTQVNPSFMTRLAHEIQEQRLGIKGHMISLNPIRPENAADPWETKAFKALEAGQTEVSSLEKGTGTEVFRLMMPLRVEKACLECHESQQYELGDVIGGIGVSLPMQPLWAGSRNEIIALTIGHGTLWLFGLFGLYIGAKSVNSRMRELKQAEKKREDLIADLFNARDRLQYQATHDELTGLWNRAAILRTLETELQRRKRNGSNLGVIVADIDHFKQVNDDFGHLVGDAVLREVDL